MTLPCLLSSTCTKPGTTLLRSITQPDRPQGRKQELIPSKIKRSAEGRHVRVEQPEDVNAPGSLASLGDLKPDLLVTAAYGQILSGRSCPFLTSVASTSTARSCRHIEEPRRWRAIQNNETESGVTVIRMTPQIDAGGIISIARTPIDPEETAGELEERLAQLGAPLIVEAIAALTAGTVTILPQDRSKVTKAPKLRKEDGLIDWSQPASSVHNLVRAMQPWPVAYTTWRPRSTGSTEAIRWIVHKTQVTQGNGEPGEVIEAAGDRLVVAAGEGAVALLTIQLAGRKPFAAAEFRRGQRVQVSDRLGF